jgi:hypothetical protein
MANFIVRVELHDADSSDYDTLHEAMEVLGFARAMFFQIGNKTPVLRHLPTAEYNIEGNYTSKDVFELGHTAAESTGKKYMILLTKADEIWSYNLPTTANVKMKEALKTLRSAIADKR